MTNIEGCYKILALGRSTFSEIHNICFSVVEPYFFMEFINLCELVLGNLEKFRGARILNFKESYNEMKSALVNAHLDSYQLTT